MGVLGCLLEIAPEADGCVGWGGITVNRCGIRCGIDGIGWFRPRLAENDPPTTGPVGIYRQRGVNRRRRGVFLLKTIQMNNDKRNHRSDLQFHDAIAPYLRGCPGPAIAEKGLLIMACQHVPGIPGLDGSNGAGPFRSVKGIAQAVCCTPGHLSRVALERGYSFGLAIRWITLLQGIALRRSGSSGNTIARSLGFSDPAGWTPFTQRLIGKTPSRLPNMPLAPGPSWQDPVCSLLLTGKGGLPRHLRKLDKQPLAWAATTSTSLSTIG